MVHDRVLKILNMFNIKKSKCADAFGVTHKTFTSYLKPENEHNLWQYLPKFLEWHPEIARDWLFFGEGEMLATPQTKPQAAPQAIPLKGFASCDVQGWHGTMTIPVPVSAPPWHNDMIACMSSGESMLPAGIGNGHICYCDPNLTPTEGDAVFVEQKGDMSTIKLFCGRDERQGKEFVLLKGWLDKANDNMPQQEFNLSVLRSNIVQMAPVIYVRRRL